MIRRLVVNARVFWWNWRKSGGICIWDRELAADKTFMATLTGALKEAEARRC